MKARRLVLALTLAALALGLPAAAPARPRCTTGVTCVPNPDVCYNYCAQLGLVYDYCNFVTGCCYCSN